MGLIREGGNTKLALKTSNQMLQNTQLRLAPSFAWIMANEVILSTEEDFSV